MTPEKTIILSDVPSGKTVTLVNVNAGQGLRQRLHAMGILPKTPIKVVRNEMQGQIIINVRETRMALGRGIARKIVVKE